MNTLQANPIAHTAKWKINGFFDADPTMVAEEISELGDNITAESMVEMARNPSTELHKCFEWNDTKAAEKYRKIQAGTVVRMLVIDGRELGLNEHTSFQPIRLIQKAADGEPYHPITMILQHPDEYQELLNRALRELTEFQNKYSALNELAALMEDIQKIITAVQMVE